MYYAIPVCTRQTDFAVREKWNGETCSTIAERMLMSSTENTHVVQMITKNDNYISEPNISPHKISSE